MANRKRVYLWGGTRWIFISEFNSLKNARNLAKQLRGFKAYKSKRKVKISSMKKRYKVI